MNAVSPRLTADDLKAQIDITGFIRSYGVELIKDGSELKACCPFHDEKTPSFTVTPHKGMYHCFGCGAGGSAIDFVMQWKGCGLSDALRECSEWLNGGVAIDQPANRRDAVNQSRKRSEWTPVIPVPDGAGDPPAEFVKRRDGQRVAYPIVARWAYTTSEGRLIGYVNRFEFAKDDGSTGKDVIPCVYAKNETTGRSEWRWLSFPKPRPIYGLYDLAARPSAQVLIVEGEKTRDAAARLLPGLVVVTWPGGSKAIAHVDWQPLAGRKVVLWPDRDPAGVAAMEGWIDQRHELKSGVLQHLEPIAAGIRVVDPPAGDGDGWDLADAMAEGWDTDAVMAHIRAAMRDPRPPSPAVAEQPPEYANDNYPDDDDYAPPPGYDDHFEPPPSPSNSDEPFRCLGYGAGHVYYYMPKGTHLVMELSLGGHSPANMLGLAPLSYWENRYSNGDAMKRGSWQLAANAMIQQSERAGMFDPDRIRGRGAWWDDGKPAIHVGKSVIIDRREYPLHQVPSRYIYQQGKQLEVMLDDPLSNRDSSELAKICEMPSWQKPVNAKLLAGWIFLAPICGALRWRPHVWVTGSAGSGKSAIIRTIINRALGNIAIDGSSSTTEAGLRQTLQSDALPVVFDEMETEDKNSENRIRDIIKLVTLASDENGRILKGSAGGKAVSYRIRTMFAFASIAVNLGQHAARTRVTVLEVLKRPQTDENRAHYQEMLRRSATVLTPEYVERLHARAIRMIPVIRKNVDVFSSAAAIKFSDQRTGDQIGTLLAGAYALHNQKEIDIEEAIEWMNKQDWDEVISVNDQSDENLCLQHILQSIIEVESPHSRLRLSIGELVASASYRPEIPSIDAGIANDTLKRHGLKVAPDGYLLVANQHIQLKQILRDTPWVNAWCNTLSRLPGAEKVRPEYFAGTVHNRQRCVSVPLSVIFG